jgi:hypothetical protein
MTNAIKTRLYAIGKDYFEILDNRPAPSVSLPFISPSACIRQRKDAPVNKRDRCEDHTQTAKSHP